MKKILILAIIILSIFAVFLLNIKSTTKLSKSDCDEFGICKEGLTAVIDNETFVISKETCLKYNKQWRDDLKACYMR